MILNLFADFIRKHSNVSSNIQDKFLITAIRESIDIDLQEVIGTKLLDKLSEFMVSEDEDEIFSELLNIVKYFVSYTTIARLAVISSVKIDNIGLNRTEDEKIKSLDMSDVFSVESFYYNKSDVYKRKIQKFIWANRKFFSTWLTNYALDEIKANLYSAASCNIFLGGARSKTRKKY